MKRCIYQNIYRTKLLECIVRMRFSQHQANQRMDRVCSYSDLTGYEPGRFHASLALYARPYKFRPYRDSSYVAEIHVL
jgi:hypothetical protein